MEKRPGYIAISRAIFDHPLLKTKRPFSRLEAWEWLINAAAWKPQGTRNRFGVIHTERGQVCTTERELVKSWGWPKTNVHRFLQRLAAEAMVTLAKGMNGPKTGPKTGPNLGYVRTLITICNYEKFQESLRTARKRPDQKPDQKPDQSCPQLPGFMDEFGVQPANHYNHSQERRSAAQARKDVKPNHGAKGRGMVWLDHGTPEWNVYAADFREVRGVEKMPESRLGGRGNWFRLLGEAKKRA